MSSSSKVPQSREDLRRRRQEAEPFAHQYEDQKQPAAHQRRRPQPESPRAIFARTGRLPFAFQQGATQAQAHGQVPTKARLQDHPEASVERREQVPLGIWLMNEISDALTIGSDFGFLTGLIIIVIVLAWSMYWSAE